MSRFARTVVFTGVFHGEKRWPASAAGRQCEQVSTPRDKKSCGDSASIKK
jgi:hypothetical protein